MPNENVTTAIAVRDETSAVMLTNAQLQMIANTSFVPAAFRGKVPEVLACVATGRALGLPDMTALRGINIIDGKATLSAELMVAIVRAHNHSITGSATPESAIAKGKRADNGDAMEAEWTIEMARRVQVYTKGGKKMPLAEREAWQNYPEAMLWARAVSQLCRMLFADCFAGATYVPEEVELTADETLDDPDWSSAGGLTEPGRSLAGNGAKEDMSEAAPVASDQGTQPGSVSPWADLKSRADMYGNTPEMIEVAKDLFKGRKPSELSKAECDRIAKQLGMTVEQQEVTA